MRGGVRRDGSMAGWWHSHRTVCSWMLCNYIVVYVQVRHAYEHPETLLALVLPGEWVVGEPVITTGAWDVGASSMFNLKETQKWIH